MPFRKVHRRHLAITRWNRHAAQPARAQGKTVSEGKKTLPPGFGAKKKKRTRVYSIYPCFPKPVRHTNMGIRTQVTSTHLPSDALQMTNQRDKNPGQCNTPAFGNHWHAQKGDESAGLFDIPVFWNPLGAMRFFVRDWIWWKRVWLKDSGVVQWTKGFGFQVYDWRGFRSIGSWTSRFKCFGVPISFSYGPYLGFKVRSFGPQFHRSVLGFRCLLFGGSRFFGLSLPASTGSEVWHFIQAKDIKPIKATSSTSIVAFFSPN